MKSTQPATGLPEHLTSAQLCLLLGLTRGRLAQLTSDDGGPIKRVGRDRYAVESVPAFVRRLRERGDRSDDWNSARTALARERALSARLARERSEGEVLPRSSVISIVSANNKIARDGLLGMSVKLPPRLHAAPSVPAVQLILDTEVRERLEMISETALPTILEKIEQAAARADRREIRTKKPDDGEAAA